MKSQPAKPISSPSLAPCEQTNARIGRIHSSTAWLRRFAFALTMLSTFLGTGVASFAAQETSPAGIRSPKEGEDFLARAFTERAPIETTHLKRKWLDLSYANVSPAEKLDIFLPNKGVGPFPVIVAIHGGSFKMGDKRDFQIVPILKAVDYGYAVVSINYRLTDEAKFPSQVQDVKAAIRWIRAHSRTYHLNPRAIALWGDSAGGYLSTFVGASAEDRALEDLTMGNPDECSDVSAVVDWYGPIDFSTMTQIKRMDAVGVRLFGKSAKESPETYAMANPETHLTSDAPPILIQHGGKDSLIPYSQSIEFANKYREIVGEGKVTLEIFPGADHLDEKFNTHINIERVIHFLDEHLKSSDHK